jgi:glycosyltransferase involved in cell wall biosynthesis
MADALAATGKYELVSVGIGHQGRAKYREVRQGRYFSGAGISDWPGLSYWCHPAGDWKVEWPKIAETFGPDVVIALGDLWMFECIADMEKRPFQWIHWLPVDAGPYPHQYDGMIRLMDRLVLMSEFAGKLFAPHVEGRVPLARIGHGVNPAVFCPVSPEQKLELRRFWSRHLGFDLVEAKHVLLCHDTNQWRKNTPELLRMMQWLPKDTVLILHCSETAADGSGGWDLPTLAKVFGVADRVKVMGKGPVPLDLAEADLASLIQACDIRVSATTGEGFGVCTIDAAACGLPTVITDYTTSAEIVGPDAEGRQAGLLAKVLGFYTQSLSPFQRALVDARDMAAKVKMLCDDADLYRKCSEEGVRRVREKHTTEIIGQQWVDLVQRHLRG